MSQNITLPTLISDDVYKAQQKLAGPCFQLSALSDLTLLLNMMESYCIASIEIEETTAYDDNDYFSYSECKDITFDCGLIDARGGIEYINAVVAKRSGDGELSYESVDEFIEAFKDYDSCDDIQNEIDLDSIDRVLQYPGVVTIEMVRETHERISTECLNALVENLQSLAKAA